MKYLFISAAAIILLSCTSSNKKLNAGVQQQCITPQFNVSAPTKRFLTLSCEKFSSEINEGISFQPDSGLLKKYSFKMIDDIWSFSGFIVSSDSTFSKTLTAGKISHRKTNKNTFTVQVPTSKIRTFFNLDKVQYFEISTKAYKK